MDNPLNPIDSVLPVIAQAVIEWQVNNSPEAIKKKVTKLLNTSSDEITYKLLGFNKDSWDGQWTLDHCNGRSGESSAGDYLKNVQAKVIKEWLEGIPMPVMTPKILAGFQKQYQAEFNQRLEYKMSQLIKVEADKRATELFNSISCSTQLNDFLQVMKLINPEGTIHAS